VSTFRDDRLGWGLFALALLAAVGLLVYLMWWIAQ
jgi:hypothetical protein